MFDTASNREDYYKLLAQKIYHIRKELEDRKKTKKGTRSIFVFFFPVGSILFANPDVLALQLFVWKEKKKVLCMLLLLVSL